jgi:hypothetical protein
LPESAPKSAPEKYVIGHVDKRTNSRSKTRTIMLKKRGRLEDWKDGHIYPVDLVINIRAIHG